MKKDKAELMRVQTMIENDRMSTGDSFLELLVVDLKKLLEDYFEFRDLPKVKMEKCGDRYRIEFSIFASRVKVFEYIPKQ